MKKFIITIDTEGDNLWNWKPGKKIYTENVKYLQRFQKLANNYGFQPTWLTNYEMLQDDNYIKFIEGVLKNDSGELGMHLHAWNTPPDFNLKIANQEGSYLIEYPEEIMEEKIATMTELIKNRTGITPVSHRAGRWAIDSRYLKLLYKYGYKIDCSVTPHVNWNNSLGQTKNFGGLDYSMYSENPYIDKSGILEVPVTIRKIHKLFFPEKPTPRKLVGSLYKYVRGGEVWLRPNGHNLQHMLTLIDIVNRSDNDYIMFMLHSSEMMPNGSPFFKTEESIEKLYYDVEKVFMNASKLFYGIKLKEYTMLN